MRARSLSWRGLAAIVLGIGLLAPTFASGQGASPYSLPVFAWPQPAAAPDGPAWEGSYASMSTGFQVTTSRRFGTFAGPTVGFEGGRLWREGAFLYGVVGGFDYTTPIGGYPTPGLGQALYTRDLAGALQLKAGALVTDSLLLYAKVGGIAAHETQRFGPAPGVSAFSRDAIAVRPDARVGVEWAVTDRLTVGVEAGVTGPGLR